MVDPIQLIPEMFEKVKNGADVVQCSRYTNPSDADTIPFSYKFYQFFYRIFVRVCLGSTIADSTYAFKLFDRERILELGMTQNRFSISPEIFLKSYLSGLKIDYVLGAQGTRKVGFSKFKFTKEGFGFLYCLVRAWLHRHKIIYWF
jgi:dolichol-phosphate mannosyltransferase